MGPAVGVVVDGCPPGLPLAAEEIQAELDRRRPGQSALVTPRKEADLVEILVRPVRRPHDRGARSPCWCATPTPGPAPMTR